MAKKWMSAGALLALAVVYYRVLFGSMNGFVLAIDGFPGDVLFVDFKNFYYRAGLEILATHKPPPGFYYSPLFALLMRPLTTISRPHAVAVWAGVQGAAIVGLWLVPALAYFRRSRWFLLSLLLVLSSFPIAHNLKWGQVSVFLTLGVMVAWVLLRHGRRAASASVLALVTAIKFYPVIFIAYFLLKRDFRYVAVFTAASAVFLVVVPSVYLGFGDTLHYYQDLNHTLSVTDSMQRSHGSMNIAGVAGRYLGLDSLLWPTIGGYMLAGLLLACVAVHIRRKDRHEDLWGLVLLFLTIPLIIKTCWVHYFVYLPFCCTFLIQEYLSRFHQRNQRALGLLVLSLAATASSTVLFGLFDSQHDYYWSGVILLSNLMLISIAVLCTFWGVPPGRRKPVE